MAKIFIYPATSLILSDMVTRFGHTPLGAAIAIRERVQTAGLESIPLQITPEEPKKGLRWAAVEVPSGVPGAHVPVRPDGGEVRRCDHHQQCRPRVRLHGLRTDKQILKFLIRQKDMPKLELEYPKNEEEGTQFVAAIKRFLTDLGGKP